MRNLSLLFTLVAICLCVDLASVSAENRPNVILVMTDDQGYGDLGAHGNEQIDTPNLDKFAKESLGMERFYVNPLCAPTRASLMTGRYHLRTGVLHTSRGAAKMFGDEVTLAELLRGAGYRTGIFGKWHLGDNYPMRPQDQGFEETLIHKSGGIGQTPDVDGNYFEPVLWRNGVRVDAKGYCTDLFFDATLEFIKRESKEPFFVYVAPNVPHSPLEVSERYSDPFVAKGIDLDTAKIYGMLKNLDENVGRLLSTLDDADLSGDTLVIFMTDNGPTPARYNADLRGAKGSVYEGGIRVPFYVRWPGQLPAKKRIDRIAAHVDVLPTILDLIGVDPPNGLVLDGKSLAPLWTGESSSEDWPNRTLFTQHIKSIVQSPYQNAAVFTQRYKLVSYPKAANEGHFKADPNNMDLMLFDLVEDRSESTDLFHSKPEIAMQLRREYDHWFKEMKNTRGFRPGLIHMGTSHENPTHLCRYQDGHRPYGTDPEPIGWPVKINKEGRFRVSKVGSGFLGAVMAVQWQGVTLKTRMSSSQAFSSSLVECELEAGEGMLDIWIEDLSGKKAARDFDVLVERIR